MVVALAASNHVSTITPRVLIVSRRSIRKNKFVDFVGEYHLDLLVSYGALPVIIPRVRGVHSLLDSFEPIHGVLLCEGEDIDPSLYLDHDHDHELPGLSPEDMEEVRRVHSIDTTVDKEKDTIELTLAKLCLDRGIPFLGICRGSQILNVASGGTLYQDIEKEFTAQRSNSFTTTKHIDYDNYDGHRHAARVVQDTPLHRWFQDSLEADRMEIMVNSYHHQGVKRLAKRFVAMAYAPDGLIEGFYDPNQYDPDEGQFLMGLQFHPERMRRSTSDHDDFDYPGCPFAYQEFVKAAISFKAKTEGRSPKLNKEMEIMKSISLAEFVEVDTSSLSRQEEKRLKQMGATVRNSRMYLKRKEEQERGAIIEAMEKLSVERLSDILSFHHSMAHLSSNLIHNKLPSILTLIFLHYIKQSQHTNTIMSTLLQLEIIKKKEMFNTYKQSQK